MGTSLSYKLSKLKGNSKKFINRETIENITWETQFEQDEVFSLLNRFEILEPDSIGFSISILKLKSLREFKSNPYRELLLHAIDIYKIIYDYLRIGNRKNYPDKEVFKIHIGLCEGYQENGREFEEKNNLIDESTTYLTTLLLEDDTFFPNTELIIDFPLFCLILNEFNTNKTIDQKFKMSFNIFDINKDEKVCYKDLKNFYNIVFKDYQIEKKNKVLDKFVKNILKEFKDGDTSYEIDFNNFQKILWTTNFISNLTIEP